MSGVLERVDPAPALARMHAEIDALQGLELSGLSDDALLDYGRERERLRRRLATLDHAFVLELEARQLAERYQLHGPAQLLRGLLRLDPGEAKARVAAAHAAGVRRALTGQPLPAVFAEVAAAQAAGAISERHAHVIVATIDKLPDQVAAEHGGQIEADLVGYGAQFDPRQLAKLAERIATYYDPDGRLKDVDYRAKHRELTVTARADGSSSIKGEATAELTELLMLHLDAFAKPQPETDGVKDPRTAGQRRHDALLDALKLNVRARQLPTVGGVTATIVLTMTAEQFEQRQGLATTAHGALIPVPEAMRIAGAEYRLMNVVLDKTQGISAYSSTHRLFTEAQRLAMLAADGPGCSFPHCPMPIHWCEIDHVIDYANGGPTTVTHGVPACRHHNQHAKKQGWRSTRINGRAAWIPPKWIDPQQRPQYNLLHNPNPPP